MIHDAVAAIQTGDVAALKRLLSADPTLAHGRVDGQRTLLHVATDWPGHFPAVRETIATLLAYGADVNARFVGGDHSETPIHWAASSDDTDALEILLEHGADVESPGAVIGGGTPLADAVAFGQWRSARKLIEHGARSTLWQAAALGLMDRMEEYLWCAPAPPGNEVTKAFWCACHGGQLAAANRLLTHGADVNWIGYDGLTALDAAARSGNRGLVDWLRSQGASTASEL